MKKSGSCRGVRNLIDWKMPRNGGKSRKRYNGEKIGCPTFLEEMLEI